MISYLLCIRQNVDHFILEFRNYMNLERLYALICSKLTCSRKNNLHEESTRPDILTKTIILVFCLQNIYLGNIKKTNISWPGSQVLPSATYTIFQKPVIRREIVKAAYLFVDGADPELVALHGGESLDGELAVLGPAARNPEPGLHVHLLNLDIVDMSDWMAN